MSLINTILQRHAQIPIPQATLDTIKLVTDIYNHGLIKLLYPFIKWIVDFKTYEYQL